jgi:hypothetical protein
VASRSGDRPAINLLGPLASQILAVELEQIERAMNRIGDLAPRSGRSPHWVKVKNPNAPAVKREAEGDWK